MSADQDRDERRAGPIVAAGTVELTEVDVAPLAAALQALDP